MNIQELSNILPLLVRFYIQIPNWKETIYYTEYSFQQCMHQCILKYFLGGCFPARKKNEQSKACGSDCEPGRTLGGPKLLPNSRTPGIMFGKNERTEA